MRAQLWQQRDAAVQQAPFTPWDEVSYDLLHRHSRETIINHIPCRACVIQYIVQEVHGTFGLYTGTECSFICTLINNVHATALVLIRGWLYKVCILVIAS